MSAAATTSPATSAPVLGHRFADELPELALPWQAEAAPDPSVLVLDERVAGDLGLDAEWLRSPDGVSFLLGADVPEGARPVAQAYAAHQFGSWNPRLGDGRALLLGELTGPDGQLHDLHLKGSGRTPFARAGDGRAVVGPMLREHVVSSALQALGVPTTRALAVVATGRPVQREELLPGAVLVRTASSHLRVGSFQYARSLGDHGLLRRLADHAVSRHQRDAAGLPRPERYRALLDGVVARQAELVAQWMLLGFVHGVMNTDNMAVSGQTIDLGPCAFVDAYDPAASFSSIDTAGRYAYGQQPGIAEWDLARFAEAVLPLLVDDDRARDDGADGAAADPLAAPGAADRAVALATESLGAFRTRFAAAWTAGMHRKLGFADTGAPAPAPAPAPRGATSTSTASWGCCAPAGSTTPRPTGASPTTPGARTRAGAAPATSSRTPRRGPASTPGRSAGWTWAPTRS